MFYFVTHTTFGVTQSEKCSVVGVNQTNCCNLSPFLESNITLDLPYHCLQLLVVLPK